MNQLIENFKNKWPTYLFEILVLVIGIYGAFALERWNEHRIERKLEHKYLQSLHTDISKDLKSLEIMYAYRETASAIAHKILLTSKLDNTFEAQLQFSKDLMDAVFWWEFTPNDNTFQELRSSGNLSIIENESFKNGLLNLESINQEIVEQRNHMRRDYDHYLYDELFQLDQFALIDYKHMLEAREVTFLSEIGEAELSNLTETHLKMLNNKKIRNGLKLIILNNAFLLDLYDDMKRQIDALTAEITPQQKHSSN